MIILYQFSLPHLYIALYKVGRMYFWNLGVKGLKYPEIMSRIWSAHWQSLSVQLKCPVNQTKTLTPKTIELREPHRKEASSDSCYTSHTAPHSPETCAACSLPCCCTGEQSRACFQTPELEETQLPRSWKSPQPANQKAKGAEEVVRPVPSNVTWSNVTPRNYTFYAVRSPPFWASGYYIRAIQGQFW